VALSIDTKIPLTLFLLRQEAQKKKLGKKKMPSALVPRRHCYAQGGRFCKSDAKQSTGAMRTNCAQIKI
jgi:hypothetical protein